MNIQDDIQQVGDKAVLRLKNKIANVEQASRLAHALHTQKSNLLEVCIPATLAQDYMLVQILALVSQGGKRVTLQWTDHEPSTVTSRIIQSLTQAK